MENNKWLDWAIELQALAQAGLHYSKDKYDIERFERIREISADIISEKSDISPEKVKNLFCSESGYQTPKLDTRAAIFEDGKILLVREEDGKWSLPGGWVDVNLSIKENTVKEAYEEAGLTVTADYIIAVQDRKKHNFPVYAINICKFFVMCTSHGGEFIPNSETIESGYFTIDNLPPLATEKTTEDQIKMCFDAYKSNSWTTLFD